MRHACLLVVLFVSACGWAQTSAETKFNGNTLLEKCGALVRFADAGFTGTYDTSDAHWCLGYLDGFIQALDESALVSAKTYDDYKSLRTSYVCAPAGSTIGQDARILVKFLNDHPERLHEDEGTLTFAALVHAFPCAPPSDPKPKAK
jgi:Rap1a immunity proteins